MPGMVSIVLVSDLSSNTAYAVDMNPLYKFFGFTQNFKKKKRSLCSVTLLYEIPLLGKTHNESNNKTIKANNRRFSDLFMKFMGLIKCEINKSTIKTNDKTKEFRLLTIEHRHTRTRSFIGRRRQKLESII